MACRLAILILPILLFVLASPAEAYLDANTGSLLIQLLVGGVAGLALMGKLMWHRITRVFRPDQTESEDH
jgi:hypothetical protein